jgi:hypothetical protein
MQVLLDLAAAATLLVEGDADLAVRRRHGPGLEARVLALDVEEADLAEVEQALVVAGPVVHAAAIDVVREVVDDRKPQPTGRRSTRSSKMKSMS